MADEDTEQVTAASTELSAFFSGNRASGSNAPSPYEDISNVKEAEALKHCGMRSDLSCRICHDDTCRVRMSKRTF